MRICRASESLILWPVSNCRTDELEAEPGAYKDDDVAARPEIIGDHATIEGVASSAAASRSSVSDLQQNDGAVIFVEILILSSGGIEVQH